MQNINIGIIGAGYIAEEHLKAIDHIDGIAANMIYSRTYDKSLDISEAPYFALSSFSFCILLLIFSNSANALNFSSSAFSNFSLSSLISIKKASESFLGSLEVETFFYEKNDVFTLF